MKEEYFIEKVQRILLKDLQNISILEKLQIRKVLIENQIKMRINNFQIENYRIKTIFINDEALRKEEKYFSDIEVFLFNKKPILEIKVEVELIPFGKNRFSDYRNTKEKKRYLGGEGEIFFINSGKYFHFYVYLLFF